MRYKRITLENFLVFKGEQTLELPAGNGVVIVYGRNGKGKTSLLNAFRWVWTGVVRSRGTRTLAAASLPNERAIEMAFGEPVRCRVRLEFEAGGAAWDLTRTLSGRGSEQREEITLLRDGTALSVADAHRQVAELMPKDIEQFFLFDGELLDQYEKLADDDSAAGATLKAAIERILGLPVLENAARDSRSVSEDAGRLVAEAAKRNAQTKRLGEALEQAQVIQQETRANYEREDLIARELESELRELEQQMAEKEGKLELKAQRDELAANLLGLQERRTAAEQRLEDLLAEAWRAVLIEPIERRARHDEAELEQLNGRLNHLRFAEMLATQYASGSDDHCPVCSARLGPANRASLEAHLAHVEVDELRDAEEQVAEMRDRLRVFRRGGGHEVRADIRAAEEAFQSLLVAIEDANDDIEELNEKLTGDEGALSDLATRFGDVRVLLDRAKSEYSNQRADYQVATANVASIEEKIRKTGSGSADPAVYRRQETAAALAEMFETAIVLYRDRMKENVQETASSIFRDMRSEHDFRKLTINESYGLRIIDSQGNVVQGRSAGYEHLVALSLLGALQQCSPITGPIVMDSPFGRLDNEHVDSVVGNLDKLSDQVFLLVHERELSRESAREVLRGRMLAEFELERVDSRETRIREVHQ